MTAIYLIDPAGILAGPVTLPVVPGIGIQLPSNAIELADALSTPDVGHVLALVDGKVKAMIDLRGPVFKTTSGEQVEWAALGSLPEGYTTEPRPDPFHVWRDGGWHLDEEALTNAKLVEVLASRDDKLRLSTLRIAPLQDAHDLGESTETEESLLISWKRYRIALNRIEQQPGYPADVDWPMPPDALDSE
ncbi:tail fiber assembly protein [Pseudomonas sp. CDFA 553]|uniref:tail fiber assembly protein n=1 Tax=Pseudomonas quasicaspiana TaxID=2829821 RepID=UPI001E2EC4FB|nr:tail fiber assembly protein [Pseudomonas quasicaspiana]MCD5991060.1 tail fiber assembly protein [Pseudomonas quasicaspiana]